LTPSGSTQSEAHEAVLCGGWQFAKSVREGNGTEASLDGRQAMLGDLVVHKFSERIGGSR